ncbi:MAG: glycosyltransferase family 2 protein [Fusobacteriaceae bacterium]
MNKKVSILIPVYNTEIYLEECLNSAITQTYKNLEIICINDGSTDGSLKILEQYFIKDNRIKIINKENGGLSSARNAGIANSVGYYVFHLDSDDYINDDTIEKLITSAEKNNSDVVLGNIRNVYSNFSRIWKDSSLESNLMISGKEFLENYYFTGTAKNSVCNKLWRKKLYEENNIIHPENISLGEDGGTLPKLMLKAQRVNKIDEIVYNYRLNEFSMTTQNNKKILDYIKAVEGVKQFFYKNNEINFFDKYEKVYLCKLFYTEVLAIPYCYAKKNNYGDYIIGWDMLLKDLNNILIDDKVKKTLFKKQMIILKIYKVSPMLGDLVKIVWNRIRGN